MAHACPGPFAELAIELGPDRLADGLADLGLLDLPGLPLELARSTLPEPTAGEEALISEGLGQGNMTVSPLQMAWMVASIANDGDLPALRLVRRIGSEAEGWELVVPAGASLTGGMSAQTADGVTQAMRTAVQSGAASGAAVSGQDVAGHVGTAVSGPGNARNNWFLGFAPALAPRPFARYVVVVLLEESASPDEAASIGGEILAAACLTTP
jgi:peptidoglycan glycosyltransferase